jgi:Zn-dependent M32 family carboxypeptidase
MTMREAYEKKLQAQLDEWAAEIKKLKAKADKAGADAKLEYHKQIEDLRALQERAKAKFAALKETGDDAWEDLKGGIEKAFDTMNKALKSVIAKFK